MFHYSPQDLMEKLELERQVHWALQNLDSQHRTVVQLHFGLEGCDPCSYDEISEYLGLDKEYVRLLMAQSLRRLRHPSVTRNLRSWE